MEKAVASERAARQPVVKSRFEGPESELVRSSAGRRAARSAITSTMSHFRGAQTASCASHARGLKIIFRAGNCVRCVSSRISYTPSWSRQSAGYGALRDQGREGSAGTHSLL